MRGLEFILARAKGTRDAQDAVKDTWTWKKMASDEWDRRIAELEAQQAEVVRLEAELNAGRGRLDARLDDLNRRTVQARVVGRAEFAEVPEKLALVKSAKERGASRDDDLAEALEWHSVWVQLDPAWSPAPGSSLEAFKALYDECVALRQAFEGARKRWVEASERMAALARPLDKRSVEWYAVATQVFAEGSYEGDLIRRLVPTTYRPDADDSPADGGEAAPADGDAPASGDERA